VRNSPDDGASVPASHVHALPVDGSSKYVLDCPFTARFVAEEKRWAFEEGIINWDDVLKR
jgi:hypothetical protein